MELSISISVDRLGAYANKCPACAKEMRLVGIEPHPNIPEMVDLVTYECACGNVIAEPHLSSELMNPLSVASSAPPLKREAVLFLGENCAFLQLRGDRFPPAPTRVPCG